LQIPPEFQGIPLVTPETATAAHSLGLEVHVWTINEPQEMERLCHLGVDGIMLDFPGRLREVVQRREQSKSRQLVPFTTDTQPSRLRYLPLTFRFW
jgi:hypothetical protein